ncbi:hypothetical protein SOCE26_076230 [Sorangium cellulosum]|uniref:Secreted protein n=1 Tax=Sorangium cellulosum TaxID=56 RepID=A0A2L0F3F5_SORCE|nr:hypothetical protein [Sorangium cellulosum]AUX46118.1 hypothetical protein SOCE26_076230 [Sorangium cellulosum]
MKTLSFAAILVTVCAVAACSDDGGSGGDGGAGGEGGASGTTTTTSASSSTVSTGTGTGGGGDEGGGGAGSGDECSDQGDECGSCCVEGNQAGALEFFELTLGSCGCEAAAPCAAECDTGEAETDVCGDDGVNILALQSNEACITCVDGLAEDDACFAPATEGCDASEGCTAFVECVETCPAPTEP